MASRSTIRELLRATLARRRSQAIGCGARAWLLRLAGASPLEGGIPLMVDGKIVGAVGVSGATSEQDAQVAKAGADALK